MGDVFADIHSLPVYELDGVPCPLEDSEEVAALRKAAFFEDFMALGDALSYQLRYRDAVRVFDWAVLLRPNDPTGHRRRASRYISTLQPEKALPDLQRCLELGADPGDTGYSIGMAHYLMGDYAAAMAKFEEIYPLFTPEMGIATMFWHTAAAVRTGKAPALLPLYRDDMDVGHHTAYRFGVTLLTGRITWEEAMERIENESSDLEHAMMCYGAMICAEREGRKEDALALRSRILSRDGFWIAYAFLAAWNERKKEG